MEEIKTGGNSDWDVVLTPKSSNKDVIGEGHDDGLLDHKWEPHFYQEEQHGETSDLIIDGGKPNICI